MALVRWTGFEPRVNLKHVMCLSHGWFPVFFKKRWWFSNNPHSLAVSVYALENYWALTLKFFLLGLTLCLCRHTVLRVKSVWILVCSSVIEHLSATHKALGSVYSTTANSIHTGKVVHAVRQSRREGCLFGPLLGLNINTQFFWPKCGTQLFSSKILWVEIIVSSKIVSLSIKYPLCL